MAPTPGRFMCGTTAFHKLAASATRELARAFCHSRVGCKVQQSSAAAGQHGATNDLDVVVGHLK